MQTQMLFHKCGYSILVIKKQVGPVSQTFFADGNKPFLEKNGNKSVNVIKKCPDCGGAILMEKLLSQKPETGGEKRLSGYIPARI